VKNNSEKSMGKGLFSAWGNLPGCDLPGYPGAHIHLGQRTLLLVLLLMSSITSAATVPLIETCTTPVPPCTIYNQSVLWVLTGDEHEMSWVENSPDLSVVNIIYDVQLLKFPPDDANPIPVAKGAFSEGNNAFKWVVPKAGWYYGRVRACNNTGVPQDGSLVTSTERTAGSWWECSTWAVSYDPAFTEQAVFPRGFIIYVKLKSATGGSIQ